jgi:hypothetical protein
MSRVPQTFATRSTHSPVTQFLQSWPSGALCCTHLCDGHTLAQPNCGCVTACGRELLWSTTDVRQGDRFAPLLFALGLQGPLEEIVRDLPEVRVVAYLDDLYIQALNER